MEGSKFSEQLLGKNVEYPDRYAPQLLMSIRRADYRESIAADPNGSLLPIKGIDTWFCYELSWLNAQGKPQVAVMKLAIPSESALTVESKSLKLYLNSLNLTRHESAAALIDLIKKDLGQLLSVDIAVTLYAVDDPSLQVSLSPAGECIDHLDIDCDQYYPEASLLQITSANTPDQCLYSHLLRSHCPVTHQPDWASVCIRYAGPVIEKQSLLRYIVSFREHQGFHEQCVEKIFTDIAKQCQPRRLSVYAGFTRRGGIDISPLRESESGWLSPVRFARQ